MIVGDGMGMASVASGPVETSVDLSERGEGEGVTSVERGFLDDVCVSDTGSGVGLDCSVRHLLGFPGKFLSRLDGESWFIFVLF